MRAAAAVTVAALLCCCALALVAPAPARAADVVVIVATRSAVKALTANQAADLFLGKASDFPGGGAATPIDQGEGSPARDAFYQKAAGKAPAQMKAYWARMLFTGRGEPPVESGDSAAVKRLVAANPGLVGYIDKDALDASVRVLLTIH